MADKVADRRDYSSVFADNECAQALLELAGSPPANGAVKSLIEPSSPSTTTESSSCQNGSLDHKCKDGKSSILKRQLEEPNCRRPLAKILDSCDPTVWGKIDCKSREIFRNELVKRICLDHNYNQYKSSGMTTGRRSSPEVKQAPVKSPNKASHLSKSLESHKNALPPDKQEVTNDTAARDCGTLQQAKIPEMKAGRKNTSSGSQDLYQPGDSKYKNFNLLLKCLTSDGSMDSKDSSHAESKDIVKKSGRSWKASGKDIDCSHLSDAMNSDDVEYQCFYCTRVFQQKCYMVKHMRHAHQQRMEEDLTKKTSELVCPKCGLTIPREKFRQHSYECSQHTRSNKKQLEMNLANCQFCGIRMRRHVLVCHLAQEHCVENPAQESSFLSYDDDMDSDSSTLSGSEHDVEDVEMSIDNEDCLSSSPGDMQQTVFVAAPCPRDTLGLANMETEHPPVTLSTSSEIDDWSREKSLSIRPQQDIETTSSDIQLPLTDSADHHSTKQRFLSAGDKLMQSSDSGVLSEDGECRSCSEHLVSLGASRSSLCPVIDNNGMATSEPASTSSANVMYRIHIPNKNHITKYTPLQITQTLTPLRTDIIPDT